MNTPKITLICDLQFGSTGKGLLAGYLAERDNPDTLVSAWSPNAGHTYIDSYGEKYIHTMLPNGVVSKNLRRVMIGPGATLNIESLHAEMTNAVKHLIGTNLYIHGNATVVDQRHRDEEAGPMTAIGSTKKGCGAALIEKIRRQPDAKITARQCKGKIRDVLGSLCDRWGITLQIVETQRQWLDILGLAEVMQIEGAQGYSLGMLSGFYPYTTSRECTPAQICVDCGVPAYWPMTRIGSIRTFPIRVANRIDESGTMVGYSGPGYPDQEEITFADLGVPPELTTVTKLPRRIFTFSQAQVEEAVIMTGVDEIFLNFVNHFTNDQATRDLRADFIATVWMISQIERNTGAKLKYLSDGPSHSNISLREDHHGH